ncbi:hypothetical protein [Lacrimispora sp. 210928-DFI.3.58]|uniref:hypothetical protein n=1 Tax=Lacrimispora sp. 210928-DFI.3.58 TaxID=2883214 RepID=UPI001D06CCA0|nr:hypothetical protein [Lacrimispora sp. 210928-DFI.3.58]MCB7320792.1 hypothetical protein [Lacrimispora sp. 210928-DFI.3.58]
MIQAAIIIITGSAICAAVIRWMIHREEDKSEDKCGPAQSQSVGKKKGNCGRG